ncbi:MAG: diaminopimelate decarboxylase [Candidatus Altiarchaeales archaeon WOR_SM1_86-2]|nr:MAG: diaminopimelate decarboxylase [Candidatus Altiarchaeales archaeon WOR_SM1_86-2]
MAQKTLPFTKVQVEKIIEEYPTPFHIYDEEAIRENARRLNNAFSWVPGAGFKNYFAVKACPNPHIIKILKDEGFGTDCSSLPELIMSEKAGISGEDIMFTSNDTPAEEFQKARQLGAIINLDDITHIPFLEKHAGIPEIICFRYNPGPLREGNEIIGNPREAKYGLTTGQICDAYKIMRDKGVRRFGLHTMIVSNMLDPRYLVETASMLFDLAADISEKLSIKFEFVNLGGGVGIPYRPDDEPVDLEFFSEGVKAAYENKITANGLDPVRVVMESGRAVTGPYGYLVSTVRHVTRKYRDYVGLDSCMANLMRPAFYGAYHHITVLGKENQPEDHVYDVTGSLCENNDKFAVQRHLPEIERGDIVVIHDTGAHGHAMGFQYNGKLRSAELLLKPDRRVKQIRRAETVDDYFATLDFSGL